MPLGLPGPARIHLLDEGRSPGRPPSFPTPGGPWHSWRDSTVLTPPQHWLSLGDQRTRSGLRLSPAPQSPAFSCPRLTVSPWGGWSPHGVLSRTSACRPRPP